MFSSTEELDYDVCQQMRSVSFNVRFLCSIQTETTPTVVLYAAVPAFFLFSSLCRRGGNLAPWFLQQLENSNLACQLLGVMQFPGHPDSFPAKVQFIFNVCQ